MQATSFFVCSKRLCCCASRSRAWQPRQVIQSLLLAVIRENARAMVVWPPPAATPWLRVRDSLRSRPDLRFLCRSDALEVGILIEVHPHIGMAGFTRVTSNKTRSRGRSAAGDSARPPRNHQQQQQYSHLLPRSNITSRHETLRLPGFLAKHYLQNHSGGRPLRTLEGPEFTLLVQASYISPPPEGGDVTPSTQTTPYAVAADLNRIKWSCYESAQFRLRGKFHCFHAGVPDAGRRLHRARSLRLYASATPRVPLHTGADRQLSGAGGLPARTGLADVVDRR